MTGDVVNKPMTASERDWLRLIHPARIAGHRTRGPKYREEIDAAPVTYSAYAGSAFAGIAHIDAAALVAIDQHLDYCDVYSPDDQVVTALKEIDRLARLGLWTKAAQAHLLTTNHVLIGGCIYIVRHFRDKHVEGVPMTRGGWRSKPGDV